jgi:hypothetical protein
MCQRLNAAVNTKRVRAVAAAAAAALHNDTRSGNTATRYFEKLLITTCELLITRRHRNNMPKKTLTLGPTAVAISSAKHSATAAVSSVLPLLLLHFTVADCITSEALVKLFTVVATSVPSCVAPEAVYF